MTAPHAVNGTGSEITRKTVAGYCKWISRNDSSLPSRHTRVAGSQGACLSEKPSVRGVVPAFIESKNPGNAAPIAPWPVTPKGVLHVGIAEYPSLMAEEGHGEKGGVLPQDLDYLLALAEEAHIHRDLLHVERIRQRRRECHASLCERLRLEIERLIRTPFSWEARP